MRNTAARCTQAGRPDKPANPISSQSQSHPPLVQTSNQTDQTPEIELFHDPVVSPVTPVKVTVLQTLLNGYDDAEYLIDGFTHGFKLGYMGPRHSSFAENLRSCQELPQVVATKIEKEVSQGRVKGPFPSPPMTNFRISPIGVVPKKVEGQYRLIHLLSYPEGSSVNDFIDDDFSKVQYAAFDDAIAHVLMLGKGC